MSVPLASESRTTLTMTRGADHFLRKVETSDSADCGISTNSGKASPSPNGQPRGQYLVIYTSAKTEAREGPNQFSQEPWL